MALFKLGEGQTIPDGKQNGFCITESRIGTSCRCTPRLRQFRTKGQLYSELLQMSGCRHWQAMSDAERLNWINWVTYLPQPTLKDVAVSLRPYQNFIKRNFYLQEFYNDASLWMTNPNLVTYSESSLLVRCFVSSTAISLNLEFTPENENLDCTLKLSKVISAGMLFMRDLTNFMFAVKATNQEIDITERYLEVFGLLPPVGSYLFFESVICGSDNGQFWFPFQTRVITEAFPPPFVTNRQGFYYNLFELSRIAPTGWHVPLYSDTYAYFNSLPNLEEICLSGSDFWLNEGWGSDPDHLQIVGAGSRSEDTGIFGDFKINGFFATTFMSFVFPLVVSGSGLPASYTFGVRRGVPLRFVKDDTTPTDRCVGNNGLVYPVTTYRGQIWTTIDSRETLFNDGSPIPELEDNSDWVSATSQAYCRRTI